MTTMRVLPPVQDPELPDVDDLVIKEAKRRARRRRLRYWGVGAIAATLVGVAAACLPAARDVQDAGLLAVVSSPPGEFVSLPPEEGVLPTAPTTGELVAMIPTEHMRVWVYGDGRLITMHMFLGPTENGWPNSGFVMQRLTPEGVEMIRSYVEDGIGANNLIPAEEPDPHARVFQVRVDGKLYHSAKTGRDYGPYYWRCPWVGCEGYVSNLNTRLPASAWADKDYERYVPSKYVICINGQTPDSKMVPTKLVFAALPIGGAESRAFTNLADQVDSFADDDPWGCPTVSLDDARVINDAIIAAGFGPAQPRVSPAYTFTVPASADHDEITVWISFNTVLPHGEAEANGG